MRRCYSIIFVLIVLSMVLTGCGFFERFGNKNVTESNSVQHSQGGTASQQDKELIENGVPVLLYFANKQATKLVAERRYIKTDEAKTDIATAVVKQLLEGPAPETGLEPAIPNGTKIIGSVKVEKGIATVDLSQEFVGNLSKDNNADKLAIYSIVNSLTELKEISKVRFTIEGVIRSQVGSFVFNAPFQKSESIIDKNAEIKTTVKESNEQPNSAQQSSDDIDAIKELTDEELEEVFKHEIDFFE